MKEIYKNKEKELVIEDYNDKNHIVVKFGDLEISITKDPKFRDMALLINECGAGVCWEDKYENGKFNNKQGISGIGLYYLKEKEMKYDTIKEVFEYLKEKD